MVSSNSETRETSTELLDQLVADYVRAVERGESPDREQLLAAHPELKNDLQDFFHYRDRMKELFDPVRNATARALHLRCPHCHNTIELVEHVDVTELSCPSCGSNFSLVTTGSTGRFPNGSQRIGQFQLVEQVGIGQFGSVWKARDLTLERTVAIKIPRKGQLSSGETEMFLRDARLSAQLQHPNIVGVHEVGKQDETIYIVSDFIHGATLKEWIAAKRLTIRESAELCVKLALALHHAHESGVIHRDLKPSNIMMDLAGEPHLVDFGLAKRESGEITMTLDGQILGTPAYMSPEQARGEGHGVDGRADVYSLGVMLYELLTGELPFRGEKRMLIVQIINDDPPPPRQLDNCIPRDLQTICLKCLEKEPVKRYETALEFAEDMNRFLQCQPIHARSISRVERTIRWCRRNSRVAALSAVVLLLLATVAVISPIAAIHQAGLRRDREAAIEQARDAALQALLTSSTDDVLEVIRSLKPYGQGVKTRLDRKLFDSSLSEKQRLHVQLARLLHGPDPIRELFEIMVREETDPKKLRVVCRAVNEFAEHAGLRPHLAKLRRMAVDPVIHNDRRFRATCALANMGPHNLQWEIVADDVVGELVTQPPISVPDWLVLLQPISSALRGPLEDVFHQPQSDTERVIATTALAVFLENDADPIIELIQQANPTEVAELVRKLRPHRQQAISRLREELDRDRIVPVKLEKPLPWEPPPTVRDQIAAAKGVITPQFVICQSLPLEKFESLAGELRAGDYRPIRCRPFHHSGQIMVAAIWVRDQKDWRVKTELTAGQVQTHTNQWLEEGMRPVDIAGYDLKTGVWRCVAICVEDELADHDVHVSILLPGAQWQKSSNELMAARYVPLTTHILRGQQNKTRRCQIWVKPGPRPFRELRSRLSSERSLFVKGKLPVDISVYSNVAGQTLHGAVWHRDQTIDAVVEAGLAPEQLLERCQQLRQVEFVPVAIGVSQSNPEGPPLTTCLWHRPVQTEEAKRRESRIKANIVIALLQLGETASVLKYLDQASEPQIRTDLISSVATARVDSETVLRLLDQADVTPSARQGLLLMLAGYGTRSFTESQQEKLRHRLLELYQEHPDSGIHSAALVLLRHWLKNGAIPSIEPTEVAIGRNWYVTPHGQTMIYVRFDARSTENAPCEGRVIAIDANETTISLFRKFRSEHQSGSDPTLPVAELSWYDAVAFCEFLNEQEKDIPESESCYLANETGEFGPGLRLAPNFSSRTGYRLPTESEWKYAALVNEGFFFGTDPESLVQYGWSAENAPSGPQPVGQLLPNRRGLFDVHGNVMEWCHNKVARTDNRRRVMGGHFDQLSRHIRAQPVASLPADDRNKQTGLRVVRTIRESTVKVFADAEKAAQRGDWEVAIHEIEQALQKRPNEWFYRCQLARLKLFLGDHQGYRKVCRQLLQQLRDTEDQKLFTPLKSEAMITHEIGIAIVGSSTTLEDWSPLVEQTKQHAHAGNGNQRTWAMTLFRNGDIEKASELLADVRPTQDGYGLVKTLFFQAMAHQKLGRAAAASDCYNEGVAKFIEIKSRLRTGKFGARWRGWIYCTQLEREVRELLDL